MVASKHGRAAAIAMGLVVLLMPSLGLASWTARGPAGRGASLNALAVDPTNPSVLFAASRGVFRSENGGERWSASSVGLPPDAIVVDVAIDPTTPSIIFAATSDEVYRSTNGGAAWQATGLNTGMAQTITDIAINQLSPTHVFAATDKGAVFRTTNRGTTWQEMISTASLGRRPTYLAIDPTNSTKIYAAMENETLVAIAAGGIVANDNEILISEDEGVTWSSSPLPGTPRTLAIDPFLPTRLVVVTSSDVIISADSGASWAPASIDLMSSYVSTASIGFSISSGKVFLAISTGIFGSEDGGATWNPLAASSAIPVPQRVAVDPGSASGLWVGTSGSGVFRSDDAGTTWSPRSAGLPSELFVARMVATSDGARVFAGSSQGLFRSTDGSATWEELRTGLPESGRYVTGLSVDPSDELVVYASLGIGGLFKSVDGGDTWSRLTNAPLSYGQVVAVAGPPQNAVYANVSDEIYRSEDEGESWTLAGSGLDGIKTIAADPSNGSVIWVGTFDRLYRTTTGSAPWTPVLDPPEMNLCGDFVCSPTEVVSVAVDPLTPTTIYVGTTRFIGLDTIGVGVWRSTDGGTSWQRVISGMPETNVETVMVDPSNPATVYAGTGLGVFRSTNGADTWSAYSVGLSSQRASSILALALDPTVTTRLYAGTSGAGVFTFVECGDGFVDDDVAETCDDGAANGTFGSCCVAGAGETGGCRFRPVGTACRDSACGVGAACCDAADTCTAAGECPDTKRSAATVCRASAGVCDVPDHCDGVTDMCPADAFAPAVTQCRPAAGDCDAAEFCTGAAAACPADVVRPTGSSCRPSAGLCDPAETCDGVAAVCPTDLRSAAGAPCRVAVGPCDTVETCDGTSATCPADALAASGTPCRLATGLCDVAEQCTGSSPACPGDGFAAPTVACRAARGECDAEDFCPGDGPNCPDTTRTGQICRDATGPCDATERCQAELDACPADVFLPEHTTCGPGSTDTIQVCDGAGTCESRPRIEVCGDSVVTSSEQCDDGNLAGGDACSPTCRLACTADAECAGPSGCVRPVCEPDGLCGTKPGCTGDPCTETEGPPYAAILCRFARTLGGTACTTARERKALKALNRLAGKRRAKIESLTTLCTKPALPEPKKARRMRKRLTATANKLGVLQSRKLFRASDACKQEVQGGNDPDGRLNDWIKRLRALADLDDTDLVAAVCATAS